MALKQKHLYNETLIMLCIIITLYCIIVVIFLEKKMGFTEISFTTLPPNNKCDLNSSYHFDSQIYQTYQTGFSDFCLLTLLEIILRKIVGLGIVIYCTQLFLLSSSQILSLCKTLILVITFLFFKCVRQHLFMQDSLSDQCFVLLYRYSPFW